MTAFQKLAAVHKFRPLGSKAIAYLWARRGEEWVCKPCCIPILPLNAPTARRGAAEWLLVLSSTKLEFFVCLFVF